MPKKGEVEIEIKADDKASAKMKNIGTATQRMSANFKKAGIAMTALGVGMALALGKMVNNYSKAGDEIQKMAKRTGFSTEALSKWKHVAKLSGTELGSIEKGSRKLSSAIVDAGRGLETYSRLFEELGLDINALRAMSPEEQFITISTAIADLEDQTLRADIASKLFGARVGTELVAMMGEGSEAIHDTMQEAEDFNLVLDQEAADACAAFEDSKGNLVDALDGIKKTIVESIMPVLTDFIKKIKEGLQGVIEWSKEKPTLTKALVAFLGVMTALTMTGGPMLLFIGFLPQMKAGVLMVAGVLTKTLIPAIIRVMAAFIAMFAAMGPAGWAAIAVGVAAAGLAIYGMLEHLKRAGKTAAILAGGQELGITVPEMQKGGIIKKPTLAFLGERGPEAVIPLSRGAGAVIHNEQHIHIGNFMGTESDRRALARALKELMGQDVRRTSFAGINRLGYFPGSSAP